MGRDIIAHSFCTQKVLAFFLPYSTEVGQMSFGCKRNFMMIENQLDFHFLRSNARKDGTQSSGDRSNSDVHQSNDNLQSSFNSSRI